MYLLKTIEIKKLFNKYDKSINFHKDINFFIGENGTGKTTILRIILSVLRMDVYSLYSLPFKSVELEFIDYIKKTQKILIKTQKKERNIVFSLTRGETITFSLPFLEQSYRERLEIDSFYNSFTMVPSRFLFEDSSNDKNIEKFKKIVEENINFDDLSVERLSFKSLNVSKYKEKDTSIDKIVKNIINNLTEYFKDLSLSAAKKDNILKETYVMSFLKPSIKKREHTTLSVDKMEQKLINILKTFSVDKSKYQDVLKVFIRKYREETENNEIKQDSLHMLQIIDKYDEVEEEKEKILSPRQKFLEEVNKLLKNKEFKYEELKGQEDSILISHLFIYQDGKKLEIEQLSSGEKHMLILLGKTLLQKNLPKIFIADEPEISLHIEWQEKIVSAIRKLNENAQIIFATHSPEIVSIYGDKIHDLSERT